MQIIQMIRFQSAEPGDRMTSGRTRRAVRRASLLLCATLAAALFLAITLAFSVRANVSAYAQHQLLQQEPPPKRVEGGQLEPLAPDAVRDLRVSNSLASASNKAGPGNLIVYRIMATNVGNSTASDVTITDTLPVSLTYVSDWNSDGYTTIITGNTVVWTGPFIDAGTRASLYLAVRIADTAVPGEVLTSVVEISSGEVDQDLSNNVEAHTVAVETPSRDLSISKGLNWMQSDRIPGYEMTYGISFANEGASPLVNVVLSDTLPVGVSYLTWDGKLYNPYPIEIALEDALSATVSGDQLVWALGMLEGGAYGYIRPRVRVLETTSPGTVVTNVVYISTTDVETASVLSSNVSTYTTTILSATVDLEIRKDLPWSGPPPLPGSEIAYDIHFENLGVLTATDVIITDTVPVSATYISWYGYAYNPDYVNLGQSISPIISGNQVVWHLGDVVGEGTGYVQLTVHITDSARAGQVLTNVIEIVGNAPEPSYANNVDDAVTVVEDPQRDLSVYKGYGDEGAPGGEVEYSISFSNWGSSASAADVTITDTLPVSLTFVSWTGELRNPYRVNMDDTISATVTLSQVVWRLGDIVPGGGGTIYLRARITDTANVGSVLQNRVEITTTDVDSNPGNNSYTRATTVLTPTEDLYVRKTLVGDPPAPGGTVQYGVYFENEGSLPVNVTLTDTFPEGSSFVSWNGSLYNMRYIDLDEQIGAVITAGQALWEIGQLLGGGWGYINITLRVADTANAGDVLTNTVETSRGATETDLDDNDAVQITRVAEPTRDLRVETNLGRSRHVGAPGGTMYYSTWFANEGNARAENVVLTDTLPSNATLVSWWGDVYDVKTIDLKRTIVPQLHGNQIVWPLGYLEAGEGGDLLVELLIPGSVDVGEELTNVVEISTGDAETDYSNNVSTHVSQVGTPTWDLAIDTGVSRWAGAPGGTMVYWFEFWNDGNWPASNVFITDTLADTASYVSSEGSLYTGLQDASVGSVTTPTVVGDQVIWQIGTLTPSVYGDLRLVVAISNTAQVGDPLENRVEISTSDPETNLVDNVEIRTDEVLTRTRDLGIHKYRSGTGGAPGGPMWYGINFRNEGNWPAGDVVITDTVPDNASYVSWEGELSGPDHVDLDEAISVTVIGDQLTWRLPQALAADGRGEILLQLQLTDTAHIGELIKNELEITTSDPEVNYGNNKSTHIDAVIPRVWDLHPYKSLHSGAPAPGTQVEYMIEYENIGNWEASGVVITDTLPGGVTYVSSRDETGPLTPTTVTVDSVVWSIGPLAPRGSGHLYVTVQFEDSLNPGELLHNRVEISGEHVDASPKDNIDIESVTLQKVDFPIYLPLMLKNR